MKAYDLIKQWLLERGMRQNHFADQIPVRQETLSRWLAGGTVPGRMALRRLADLTGLAVENREDWR